MNRVIDRDGIVNDEWQRYDRFATQGDKQRILVSRDDLIKYPRYFQRVTFDLGLDLGVDEIVEDISGWLPRLKMVCINFESFADGRGFSQARLLRQRHAFAGDLRACGQVLRDQLSFMYRCGINQFNLTQGEDIESALEAFSDISESYQPEAGEVALNKVVNG